MQLLLLDRKSFKVIIVVTDWAKKVSSDVVLKYPVTKCLQKYFAPNKKTRL